MLHCWRTRVQGLDPPFDWMKRSCSHGRYGATGEPVVGASSQGEVGPNSKGPVNSLYGWPVPPAAP